MPTKEQNDRLTRVGPGTPCGELMRRYWHPVAATSQLAERGTRPVRLLGEDLVLFRDRSGKLGLVGDRCPHRRAGMIFGIPEEEGLRCAYHGWRYTADGRCVEQPYEQTDDPNGSFRDRIRIKAYPVEELGGLIFAYLGPEPVPLLPRWDLFVAHAARDVGWAVIPCNWLQVTENANDTPHTEWLHGHFKNYVLERLGRVDEERPRPQYGPIGYERFEYGIVKRRVPAGFTEEHDMWKVGLPHAFPTTWRSGTAYDPVLQIQVPIDDAHTLYFWYGNHFPRDGVELPSPGIAPTFEVPVPGPAAGGELDWSFLENNSGTDISMWISQGQVSDRENEHLGRSDAGIVLFREMLEENIRKVEQGQDPMNVFRDPAQNEGLELAAERDRPGRAPSSEEDRRGNVNRYSPLYAEAARQARK